MVTPSFPILLGKVSAYWASHRASESSTGLSVQLPGHLKYRGGGNVPESPRRCGRGGRKTDSRLRLCFPLTRSAVKKRNLFARQNMVKHSCALHPLHGFKYWPVFSVFVLVPSAHTEVHGLFHSLIISPPAAGAQNGVIIQQAVQGFPPARLHSAVSSRLRHPVAVNSAGRPASCRGILLTVALLLT